METQHQQVLIYDKDCPFCRWYTGMFVKTGLLTDQGRKPYEEALDDPKLMFDPILSRNKIALVDQRTGNVKYGIDSLLAVLGQRFRWIEMVGKFLPVHFALSLFYSFISYNRKVIAPSRCNGSCDCAPDRNYFWRIVFIVFCGFIVNIATGLYFSIHLKNYFIGDPYYTDILFFSAQLVFQFVAFRLMKQRNFYDYAGQVSFVSMLGALLLLGFHFGLTMLDGLGIETAMLAPFCYGMVYLFMLYEHSRRIKILQLTTWLSITWILFRFCIYPFAFQLFHQ